MQIEHTYLKGCFVLTPRVFADSRGFFMENYNRKTFKQITETNVDFIQDNLAFSEYGVVRGLHIQKPPFSQSKLVYALQGKILDVAVDVRKGSETFGKSFAVELSAENRKQLFIPKGFLHGYSVLSETALVAYKCDDFYNKESEAGIYPLDEFVNIDWKIPTDKRILSEKDINAMKFNELPEIIV